MNENLWATFDGFCIIGLGTQTPRAQELVCSCQRTGSTAGSQMVSVESTRNLEVKDPANHTING